MSDNVRSIPALLGSISRFDDEHPYLIAFFISATMLCCALFCSRNTGIFRDDIARPDRLSFVDIETVQPQKLVATQDVSTDAGEVVPVKKVARASGSSTAEEAVDLDMVAGSNVVQPKPIGALKDLYPSLARDEGVEAIVMVEFMISADGVIQKIRVKNVRILKEVPDDLKAQLKKDFSAEVHNIFRGVRFTPAVIDGEKKAVILSKTMNFKLNK